MNIFFKKVVATLTVIFCFAFNAYSKDCNEIKKNLSININPRVILNISDNINTQAIGTVLQKKEISLTQASGRSQEISMACLNQIEKTLIGRINGAQDSHNIYSSQLTGVGIRVTVIYDPHVSSRREMTIPFNVSLGKFSKESLSTRDFRLRIELIKTGGFNGTSNTLYFPALFHLNNNIFVVNLTLRIISPAAHCSIINETPHLTLPAIKGVDLGKNINREMYPLRIKLACNNTKMMSISFEGINDNGKFANTSRNSPSIGVGFELIFKNKLIVPNGMLELHRQQGVFSVPISVRYARTKGIIKSGNVESKITISLNYI